MLLSANLNVNEPETVNDEAFPLLNNPKPNNKVQNINTNDSNKSNNYPTVLIFDLENYWQRSVRFVRQTFWRQEADKPIDKPGWGKSISFPTQSNLYPNLNDLELATSTPRFTRVTYAQRMEPDSTSTPGKLNVNF